MTNAASDAAHTGDAPKLATPVADLPFTRYAPAITAVAGESTTQGADEDVFLAREEFVAECMSGEGFAYTPARFSAPEPVSYPWLEDAIRVPLLSADRHTVEASGYGRDDIEQVNRDLAQRGVADANAEYIDGLSDEAVIEYVAALTGSRGPGDLNPAADGGCSGRAVTAYPGESDPADSAAIQFQPLISAMRNLVQWEIYSDPLVVALNAEWVGCMADAGYDVGPPAGYPEPPMPGPMEGWNLAVITGADGRAHWPDLGTATSDIPEDQRVLVGTEAEYAIAVADFDCRAETDYVATFAAALRAAESQFVEQRRDDLAAMEAAAGLS